MDAASTRLSAAAEAHVVEAIRSAEARTSAELRVHVEKRASGDPLEAAQRVFVRLGMAKTRERNAVLLYLSLRDRRFAIWGDVRAHEALGDAVWSEARRILEERIGQGGPEHGIVAAVSFLGEHLAACFPRSHADVDELPDVISSDDSPSDPHVPL